MGCAVRPPERRKIIDWSAAPLQTDSLSPFLTQVLNFTQAEYAGCQTIGQTQLSGQREGPVGSIPDLSHIAQLHCFWERFWPDGQ
jgi:hypothetical protein